MTSVSYEAFALCKNLNSVTIPSTVKTIGIRSFYGTKISKITVPSKTKTIGQGAFGSCKDLKTIVMPGDFKLNSKRILTISYGMSQVISQQLIP